MSSGFEANKQSGSGSTIQLEVPPSPSTPQLLCDGLKSMGSSNCEVSSGYLDFNDTGNKTGSALSKYHCTSTLSSADDMHILESPLHDTLCEGGAVSPQSRILSIGSLMPYDLEPRMYGSPVKGQDARTDLTLIHALNPAFDCNFEGPSAGSDSDMDSHSECKIKFRTQDTSESLAFPSQHKYHGEDSGFPSSSCSLPGCSEQSKCHSIHGDPPHLLGDSISLSSRKHTSSPIDKTQDSGFPISEEELEPDTPALTQTHVCEVAACRKDTTSTQGHTVKLIYE